MPVIRGKARRFLNSKPVYLMVRTGHAEREEDAYHCLCKIESKLPSDLSGTFIYIHGTIEYCVAASAGKMLTRDICTARW